MHITSVILVAIVMIAHGCATPGTRPQEHSAGEHETLANENERLAEGRSAAKHQRLASAHRAAAQTLRDTEARACAGLSDRDRDQSPFSHGEDIVGVEEVSRTLSPKTPAQVPAGAVVIFAAVPGMTQESLQRIIDCHQARNSVIGFDAAEMAYCPLMLKGVTAEVSLRGGALAVTIRSDDPGTAREIQMRARALTVHAARHTL